MRNTLKVVLILVIVGVLGAVYALDLHQYLTFESVKNQRETIQQFYLDNQIITIAIYVAIYIGVTALSIPGAAILTLVGGYIFGLVTGTIIISFSSTIGATLSFLFARFILRDTVQKKFGEKLGVINRGIEKEGAFYLFTLRLIPIFPFFLINLLMGLTPIKTSRYFIASQIGMLPGTIAYVFAGTQLAEIDSLSGILSPGLILAFCIIGLLPIVTKKGVSMIKSYHKTKAFNKPNHFDFNLAVIGGGSAGLVAAYIASTVKAKVALIEKDKMGGDCLNTGCVPSKALIRTAKMLSYGKRAEEFGFSSANFDFNFASVMDRVKDVISTVAPHDSIERYQELGVDCFQGNARIIDPYRVEVNGKTITTKNIVIATGGQPFVPPIPGIETVEYLTSDNIWDLREQPKRLIVLGGGPIGSEMAQCFARLGSKVSQVEMAPQILIREDNPVSEFVTERFKQEGIDVLTGHRAKEFRQVGSEKTLVCEVDGKDVSIPYDAVLVAVGRRANTTGLGLEELGIELNPNGTVQSDPLLRTEIPNIFVCGDVAGPYQFTHTASHQAWYAAVNALFRPFKSFKADYRVIPWCTFTDPEVARVGINEKEAIEQGIEYELTHYQISESDRAIADSENHGFIRIITPPDKDKILGVTIVGSHAGDLIAEFVLAMKHGLGLGKILQTIHIYPTLAESNKAAAGNWRKNHLPRKALKFLESFHSWRR